MRLFPIAVLLVPLVLLVPAASVSAEEAGSYEEYWCYGDRISLSYGNDSANVTWTVTDSAGNVRWNETGDTIEIVAPEFNTLFVTQSVQTAQGTSVKTIKLNLMHFNDKRITVSFTSEGQEVKSKRIDGSTVCKDGVFVSLPDQPAPPGTSMVFGGWKVLKDGRETDFDPGDPVTQSMDVYASWLKTYQITFISEGTYYGSSTLVEGDGLELPEMEQGDDKVFEGWYTDQKFQSAYEPGTTVDSDQVLYAKWGAPPVEKQAFSPLLLVPIGVLCAVYFARAIKIRKRSGKETASRYR